MCKVCDCMSKQRYLLIVLASLLGSLLAQTHLESGFYGIYGDSNTVWLNRSKLNAETNLSKHLTLALNAKLDLADSRVETFPQHKYLNGLAAIGYQNEFLNLKAGYRNTLFGTTDELTLYPAWNASGYYTRKVQHQSQIAAEVKAMGAKAGSYAIHKHLRAVPTEYVYDFVNDTMLPTDLPERGFDDVFYGAALEYQFTSFLSLSGFTELKQANFDTEDIYSAKSLGTAIKAEIPLSISSHIAGSFIYKNRQADYLPNEATNSFQSTLRVRHRIGTNLNGFVSYINNGCSDSSLNTFYFISQQLRCQVQYSFTYDESQASYILAGGKYSPENDANAAFVEIQGKLVPRVYALAAYKNQIASYSFYQAKLSYFFTPVSDCYVHYIANDYSVNRTTHHYLGVGSSIYF